MPPVRKNRPKPTTSVGIERTSFLFASEASVPGKSINLPDQEMTDSEPIRAENNGPKTKTPVELAPVASSSRKGKEVVREKTTERAESSAGNNAVPASQGAASTSAMEFPPELQSVMEAEKRRTTQINARIAICSTTISSVEAALSPLSIGDNKELLDGIKVHLRAAISQFVQSGPGSTLPVLPARPANPLPPRAPEIRVPNPPTTQAPAPKTTWATVARGGLARSAGQSTKKVAPLAPKAKSANPRTKVDSRLFLRLDYFHPHRLLSQAGSISALFPRESAPRPGFRLFDDSGAAKLFRPRRKIEKCKRCLEFHATRGCSCAPACWNCGSNMHSESECKALTRCRNCGGPHRSDSRACLARPSKSGPVPKEQLARIRQIQQGEFVKVARFRAAAKRAEEATMASTKDVSMAGRRVSESWNPKKKFEGIATLGEVYKMLQNI
ncbi:EKA-like protein [Blumeria hordei DH14]|uniref:EKA-like protein n=1 Tax=Blumeria graminis f. sp. hordei (strain DH14) TaxID=546991 RepID=N1J518_BLUG1|nr:EKA-like protein [Blumeria hordei DH14]